MGVLGRILVGFLIVATLEQQLQAKKRHEQNNLEHDHHGEMGDFVLRRMIKAGSAKYHCVYNIHYNVKEWKIAVRHLRCNCISKPRRKFCTKENRQKITTQHIKQHCISIRHNFYNAISRKFTLEELAFITKEDHGESCLSKDHIPIQAHHNDKHEGVHNGKYQKAFIYKPPPATTTLPPF
jgi:hypothetical protein